MAPAMDMTTRINKEDNMLKEIIDTGYVMMVYCGYCNGDCSRCHEMITKYEYSDVEGALKHGWKFLTMEDVQRYNDALRKGE